MSFQAISWAFDQKLNRSSAKFVLVCLANYANESFEAYPSTQTLSELTAMDRKTVVERLDDLCVLGFICDTGRRVGATKQIKVYQLNYKERLPKTEASQKRNHSVFPLEGSQKRDTKGSQKRDTDPVREPVREPGGGNPHPNSLRSHRGPAKTVNEIDSQLRDLTEDMEALKSKGGHVSPTGFEWHDKAILEQWKVLYERKKILRREKREM